MKNENKLIRITTVPISLEKLLGGQLKYMSAHFEVTAVSSDEMALEKVGRLENVNTHTIEMTRQITPLRDLKSLWLMCLFFRKEKPMIVHTHTPKAGLIGMLAAWLCGVPIRMHTVAGLPLMEKTGLVKEILILVEKLTYSCATKVYPNSVKLKEYVSSAKFTNPENLKVIGNGSSNGIATDYFSLSDDVVAKATEIKNAYHISEENFNFIFIGRLVKAKGIEELVKAFSNLSEGHSNIRLFLVGSEEVELDPLSDDCLLEIKRNTAIISAGYQRDVRGFLACCHVLAFPSYREGFPNVVMQAGAMGLPSIVSDINGCNEIIVEDINGLIVPVKNVPILTESMEKMLLKKDLYQEMASNARRMIVDRYDQNKVWSLILKEYHDLLKV